MEFTVGQVASLIGGAVEGNENSKISSISPIEDGQPGTLSFLSNPKYKQYLSSTKATAVIVNADLEIHEKTEATLIRVPNAYASFTLLLEEYQKALEDHKSGIEDPSFVDSSAKIGQEVYIGAFAYIGKNVKIGNGCKIHPHCFIGDNTTVGDNTVLHSGVKIYANTVIGNQCVLHAGSIIGSDGFGFAKQEDSTYKAIPQLGNVILEDNVSVGANTTIDCATFRSTIIRSGTKLDNLVQVGHNVEIGKNTVIAAQAGIAGSAKIGDECAIGGQAGIVGHIKMANKVSIQAQSGVAKANKEGAELCGTPAIDWGNFVKSSMVFKNLPDLAKKIYQLEKRLEEQNSNN